MKSKHMRSKKELGNYREFSSFPDTSVWKIQSRPRRLHFVFVYLKVFPGFPVCRSISGLITSQYVIFSNLTKAIEKETHRQTLVVYQEWSLVVVTKLFGFVFGIILLMYSCLKNWIKSSLFKVSKINLPLCGNPVCIPTNSLKQMDEGFN